MKRNNYLLCIFLSLFFFMSCSDKEMKEVSNLISVSESKLDEEQQKVIESVRDYLVLWSREKLSRSTDGLSENYLDPKELEKATFTTIPYYEVDTSFITTDLDHEHLDKYIKPVSTPLFLGKVDGKYAILVNPQRRSENEWVPGFSLEGIDYFQKVFSWLIPELNSASKKDFYVLRLLGLNYLVYYTKDGAPMFCNFPGNIRMDKIEFFQHIVERYNSAKEAKEFMEKTWGRKAKS